VVNNDAAEEWVRIEAWLSDYYSKWSPLVFLFKFYNDNFIKITTSKHIRKYMLWWFIILILCLTSFHYVPFIMKIIFCFIGVFRVVDFILIHAYLSYTLKEPEHPLRSLFLILANFFQVILSFSMFYILFESDFIFDSGLKYISVIHSIYLSTIIFSTLGYAQIYPATDLARVLVIMNIITGVVSVSVTLPAVIQWSGNGWDVKQVDDVTVHSQQPKQL